MEEIRTEPWFTETANKFLFETMQKRKNWRVFEFGSGASTIWFLKQKNVSRIISVEHDENWYKTISDRIEKESSNVNILHLLEKQPYNDVINNFGEFDLIIVDGRNRVKCIESAISHLAPNGILILDNSEREYYQPGIQLLNGMTKAEFFQPTIDKYGFTYPDWSTSFFFKK